MSPVLSILFALAFFVFLLLRVMMASRRSDGGDDRDFGPGHPRLPNPTGGKAEPLPVIDNREAATVLMTRLARAGSTLTETKKEVIAEQAMEYFALNAETAWALVEYCERETDHVDNPQAQIGRMIDVLLASIGAKELVDLDAMLVAVSEAEGLPNASQLKVLQFYRDRAGIAA